MLDKLKRRIKSQVFKEKKNYFCVNGGVYFTLVYFVSFYLPIQDLRPTSINSFVHTNL